MARNRKFRHIGDNTVPQFSSAQPSQLVMDRGFPAGDEAIVALDIRYKGTFYTSSAAGSVVTDGAKKILRSLTVETNKHGRLIDGIDGLGLDRILRLENGTAPQAADCASSADGTTFNQHLRIPFADEKRLIRPYDCLLDMANANMTVKRQYGLVTDVQSAGTAAAVSSIREDISAEVLPGPINTGQPTADYSELPKFIPVKEKIGPVAITATTANFRIPIPVGDRILRRIYISQQTVAAATGLQAEVSNIIGENAYISLKIGSDAIVDRMTWAELRERLKLIADVETLPTGWAAITFDDSNRIADMLDLYPYSGSVAANLEIDVTTQSEGYLQIYLDSLKLIPAQAQR